MKTTLIVIFFKQGIAEQY